jgi:hypothetical protein
VEATGRTFSQIHQQHKPGALGWGAGEHLRGDLAGTRLYTHSAFSISGSSDAAAKARQDKWAAGAAYVKQAIDREFGPGMGELAFAKVSRDTRHDISAELRRGDLDRLRTAVSDLRNPMKALLALPGIRGIQGADGPRVQKAVVTTMVDLIERRFAEERAKGAAGKSPKATLDAIRKEINDDPSGNRTLKSKALSIVDKAEAQLRCGADLGRHLAFATLPPTSAWRMLMDGHLQDARGEYGFENEQGYMAGMLNGFSRMLESVRSREPLDARLFETLHDTCVDKVYSKPLSDPDLERMPRDGRLKKGFRTDDGSNVGVGYPFKPVALEGEPPRRVGTTTPEGRAELAAKVARDDWYRIDVGELGAPDKLWCVTRSREQCRARVDTILTAYRTEIAAARTEDEKLRAIARCCQDLDQSHVFEDGNIRTVSFLVMNKLLLEAGLSPAILDEPNVFDGFSVTQLVDEIRHGQAAFRAACQ